MPQNSPTQELDFMIAGFGGHWRFLTRVWHPDLDLDMDKCENCDKCDKIGQVLQNVTSVTKHDKCDKM